MTAFVGLQALCGACGDRCGHCHGEGLPVALLVMAGPQQGETVRRIVDLLGSGCPCCGGKVSLRRVALCHCAAGPEVLA